MKLVESGDFQNVISDQQKVYPLIQYYLNKAGKKFFIIATLHSLFACKYYKKKSFESFLKKYDLITCKMNKDERLQKELKLDADQFKYYCLGVKTVIKMFQKYAKTEQGVNINTFIQKYKDYSKTKSLKCVQLYTKNNKSNETEISDIGTSKNNMVQVSPIQKSASKDTEMEEDIDDIIAEEVLNNNNDMCLEFSPDNTTRATRNRSTVQLLTYPPGHCGTYSLSKQSKRLKTNNPKTHQSVPVQDPLEGKGLVVKSDDERLKEYRLWTDGFMVVDTRKNTNLGKKKCFPRWFIQTYFGVVGDKGMLDLCKKKWKPCFNGENCYENAPVTRWMSGMDIKDGFFDNTDLKDKVSIYLCFFFLKHTYD